MSTPSNIKVESMIRVAFNSSNCKKVLSQNMIILKAHCISNPVKSIILGYINLVSNKLHKIFKYN